MSLETTIKENTEALRALTAAILAGGAVTATPDPEAGRKPRKAPPVTPAEAVHPAEPSTESGQAPTVDTTALDYERDVKAEVLRLAAKDKAELRTILDSYGAAKGSNVAPGDLPAFLARVQKALA